VRTRRSLKPARQPAADSAPAPSAPRLPELVLEPGKSA
jgi:hypothetical protein